ncbi:MAG: hypothetical protein ACI37S_02345 [Candidatus Gastranaerophilaceae bacterium]
MIGPLGVYFNNINVPKFSSKVQNQTNPIKMVDRTPSCDAFVRNPSVLNLSFTSVDGSIVGKTIRELGDVPCPYSGIRIINGKELTPLTKAKLNAPSKDVIPLLEPFKDRMHPVEKEAYCLLKGLSKKNPQKNLRQLLDGVRPQYLKKIKEKEYEVLSEMGKYGKRRLSAEENKKLNNYIESTIKIINDQDENYIFRRRKFIEKLDNVTADFKNKNDVKVLKEMAEEIPKGNGNLSAFVVKYSQKNPKNSRDMTPYQIGMALLRPSVGSLEHIVPRHPQDGSQGGTNKYSNYIYACCELNSMRKNMPLDQWIEEHPEIPKNMQKYIDAVIDKINNKQAMQNCRVYPILVAQTLKKESKGLIDLNVSRLKLSKAEINTEMERILREERKIDNRAAKKQKKVANVNENKNINRNKKLNFVA